MLTKEADLIYTQITNQIQHVEKNPYSLKNKSYEKIERLNFIDFKGFLKSLEVIVYKLYPQMDVKKGVDTLFYLKISKNLFRKSPDKQGDKDISLNLTTEKIN